MRWAVILVTLVLSTHHVVTQRVDQAIQYKALEEFYHATGGPTWKNNSGWLDGPPCGKDWRQIDNRVWHGLICNLENGVTNMNLINNGLKGALPDSLFTGLPDIQRINIGQNQIVGSIPRAICSCSTLLTFAAQLNRNLGGSLPSCITGLSLLEELILEMTAVTGTIPTTVFPKIKVLILSNSRFYGTIPDHWQSMADLKVLILNGCSTPPNVGPHCKLHGTIPRSMYTLPNLFLWSLQQNNLNGTLGDFQNMKKLREVHFNDNKLTGELPGPLYSQFQKPVHRENATRGMFHMENNQFSGRLLRDICRFDFMKEVGIQGNKFTAYPPKCFYEYTQKNYTGDKWEVFPKPVECLAKNNWLPGIAPWAIKMGAKAHPFQVTKVSPNIMEAPVVYGNGSYYGPPIYFHGTGFVDMSELRCAFFKPGIKVKPGDQCNGVPAGSPDGMPDCVSTRAKLWNSTCIQCQVKELPGMLGPVTAAVLFDGDDLNDVKNTTHVISPPKTIIMYEPHPLIRGISPRSGRYQGCTTVTLYGKKFVDTKQMACWFNETRVDAVFLNNESVTCKSPPLWDPEFMNQGFNILFSPLNGSTFAYIDNLHGYFPKDMTFSYYDYCDLSPHSSLMGQPDCECGMCPCSSFGKCLRDSSELPQKGRSTDIDEFVLPVTTEDEQGELHFPMCLCLPGFASANCSECAGGFYGPTCQKCDCDAHGKCNEGRGGDGRCWCEFWWSGKRCDYNYKPLVQQIGCALGTLVLVGVVAALKMRKPRSSSDERQPLVQGSGDELYTAEP